MRGRAHGAAWGSAPVGGLAGRMRDRSAGGLYLPQAAGRCALHTGDSWRMLGGLLVVVWQFLGLWQAALRLDIIYLKSLALVASA